MVIDTGYPNGFNSFKKKMNSVGITPKDIKFIFLTHAHNDHAGYLNELLTITNASLVLHRDAVIRLKAGRNLLIGRSPSRQAQMFLKMMSLLGKSGHKFPRLDMPDRYIIAGSKSLHLHDLGIPGTILMLPGHTSDSIGLILDNGYMFCGDAAMNGFLSKSRHPVCIENEQDFLNSWEVILKNKPVKIFPGHGKPIPPSDLIKFKGFLKRKKLYSPFT